ncbi:MAG TPA: glycoside hydrolase family 31 protein [Verrucomicrobiae bacterium]|jgi:alpha-glucosidase
MSLIKISVARCRRSVFIPLLCCAAIIKAQADGTNAAPGWHILDNLGTPTWDGKSLSYHGSQGTLAITPLSDDVIRVRFTSAQEFGRDHSYAVVDPDLGTPTVSTKIGNGTATLQTASLEVTVQQSPLRISFANTNGDILDTDDAQFGTSLSGDGSFRVAKELPDDAHVYGLGEKSGALDKRGWKLGGYDYVMWNSDTFGYDSGTDPMYVSVPFYMVMRNGDAHGIFLDNTWRSFFDIGHEQEGLLNFGAAGGELNYYFINGPDPKRVVERYTQLTGRIPLPPLWALGYNQCRYSYYPEARVRRLANTFRKEQVPADVIWLDIHYQDNYKPFTWNLQRFPNPPKMLSDLRAQGFHVVTIVDPHPKVEKGYAPYDEGMAGNYFVKNADGSVYEGPVWPSNAETDPGPSVFPDFSNPAARKWYGSLYKNFIDMGVAGIWNDMDEPAVFKTPTGTMPLDTVFDNEGQPTTQREIHNVYGQLMSRSTYEGLLRLRPNERPFVLTRASYAGGQRYAAVWPGDNTSDWSALRQSVSMLLGMGVSGFSFVGCDIGGFAGSPDGELYSRWLQMGVFYPFMRSHSTLGSPDKEPWDWGKSFEAINKRSIQLRYELLPYIYNTMHEAGETGLPALRPLFLEFPHDRDVTGNANEFMFGDSLLVSPVLVQGETNHSVYLPKGDWFDYWTGQKFSGRTNIEMAVTLDSIPMFVRGGEFVFRQPVIQFTAQMPGNPLEVLIAPAKESGASLYEDDGESLDYRSGQFMKRQFRQTSDDDRMTVEISAPEGSYRPQARALIVETWLDHAPKTVSAQIGGGVMKKLSGWSFKNGLLRIRMDDTFQAMRVVIVLNR